MLSNEKTHLTGVAEKLKFFHKRISKEIHTRINTNIYMYMFMC